MSNGCGCPSQNETRQQCGQFEEPSNPDAGGCWPYRVKLSCEAPEIPVPVCEDDEYSTEYTPDDPLAPFRIIARIFDGDCEVLIDGDNAAIMSTLA